MILPLALAAISARTMAPFDRSVSAAVLRCSSLPRISRCVSFALASAARFAASASRRSAARAFSLSSVASASAISSLLLFASAVASWAPDLAFSSFSRASRHWFASRSRSAAATSTAALASASFPSQGCSARCAASSRSPTRAISPLSEASISSSAFSSACTFSSSSAFFASSIGASRSIAAVSSAMSFCFFASLASLSSSFFERAFALFRSSRCWMSFRSNSANAFVASSSSFFSSASAAACVLTTASSASAASELAADLARSAASVSSSSATLDSIAAVASSASREKSWYSTERVLRSSRSFAMKSSASAFAPPSASRSFSTILRRFTCDPRLSLSSSSAFAFSSIGSTYWFVPMMSSRYSSRPSSPGFSPLGFIIEICSTSPWRIRNRLLFRSTPCALSSVVTSVKLDVFWSMKYLLVLLRYASREMTKSEPGTASKSSPCLSTISWKCTSTRAYSNERKSVEL